MTAAARQAERPTRLPGGRVVRLDGVAMRFARSVVGSRIPGLVGASFVRDTIRVYVPEADFTIQLTRDGNGLLRAEFTAVFREYGQSDKAGGTWWNTWTVDVGDAECPPDRTGLLLVEEVANSRRTFAEALSDTAA